MRKAIRFALLAGAVLLIGVVAVTAWIGIDLARSLPDYSGEIVLAGLGAPVTVERDAQGVVTLRSASRRDEARALGFVHAQERFFQMDLLRRSAAGELAALVGDAALPFDRERRVHRLRRTAALVAAGATPEYRDLLAAYTEGVNEGLTALGSPPFEYRLLRARPAPWRPEDSMLVAGAMYFDLQGSGLQFKVNEIVARSVLPAPMAVLLYPEATAWDAPLLGGAGARAVLPPASIYDLRTLPLELFSTPAAGGTLPLTETSPGSNSWAVAGARSADGRALLASDPHLQLRVPSIWFRVSLERNGRRIAGASLPGVPSVVFGSNGDVAWGFTNSYGDWIEIVALEVDPDNASRYRTPDGWRDIETIVEPIAVARGPTVDFAIRQTVFGPVLGTLPDGRPFAVHWVGHEVSAYDAAGELDALGEARDIAAALAAAQAIGMPENNIAIADRAGHVAWTIAGPIPRRLHSELLTESGMGSAWNGWLAPAEYPVVTDPASGFVFTANSRVVDGDWLAAIGRGNYALGARAGQIRDRLSATDEAAPSDMLAIQLDDEARLLAPWREELLRLLVDESDELRVAVRDAVDSTSDRASVDAVGYRILRGWRALLIERMTAALAAEVRERDPAWSYGSFQAEHWASALVSEKPLHLLDPRYASWEHFERTVLDEFLGTVLGVTSPAELAERRWGEINTVRVQHPLSDAVPWLSHWLDMPARELPGDTLMPRVQSPDFGASARFAVSPGREAEGYFHMPGGQSGHPLSSYYGAGHEDWEEGRPAPFLPGSAEQTLTLLPPASGTAEAPFR